MWIIGIFFFVSLLFYKVMPIYVFAQDNTVVAAAMMAACSAIAMFSAQTLSTAPIMRWVSDPAEKYVTFPLRHTAPWFLLCGSGAVIADVFIVQGFAGRLFRRGGPAAPARALRGFSDGPEEIEGGIELAGVVDRIFCDNLKICIDSQQ